jgi:hypothetical protein
VRTQCELPLGIHDGQGVYHATMSMPLRPCLYEEAIMHTSASSYFAVGFASFLMGATAIAAPPPPEQPAPITPAGVGAVNAVPSPVLPPQPLPAQPSPLPPPSPPAIAAPAPVPMTSPSLPLAAQPSPLPQPTSPIVAPPTPVPMNSPSEPGPQGRPGANACAGMVGTAFTNCMNNTPH